MARRKNSAEMLDVMMRMKSEEKLRGEKERAEAAALHSKVAPTRAVPPMTASSGQRRPVENQTTSPPQPQASSSYWRLATPNRLSPRSVLNEGPNTSVDVSRTGGAEGNPMAEVARSVRAEVVSILSSVGASPVAAPDRGQAGDRLGPEALQALSWEGRPPGSSPRGPSPRSGSGDSRGGLETSRGSTVVDGPATRGPLSADGAGSLGGGPARYESGDRHEEHLEVAEASSSSVPAETVPAETVPPMTVAAEVAGTGVSSVAASGVSPSRRRLFGTSFGSTSLGNGGGWGRFVEYIHRVVKVCVGDEISGGLSKRVEVRVITLALYGVVALGAMLGVAVMIDRGSKDNEKQVQDVLGQDGAVFGSAASAGGVGTPPTELTETPVASGIPAELRNVAVEGPPPEPPQQPAGERPVREAKEAAPAVEGLWDGSRAPRGHYVQIQSGVAAEHVDAMIAHLRAVGFTRIWKRSRPFSTGGFSLLLGPYPTRAEADKVIPVFYRTLKEKPLRHPRVRWADLFSIPYSG